MKARTELRLRKMPGYFLVGLAAAAYIASGAFFLWTLGAMLLNVSVAAFAGDGRAQTVTVALAAGLVCLGLIALLTWEDGCANQARIKELESELKEEGREGCERVGEDRDR